MRYTSTIAALAGLASTAIASNAPVVTGNEGGITYSATIPATNGSTVSGAFVAGSAPDGKGVNIQISLYNLPSGGPLSYGIHTSKIPRGGDCSSTGAILDPYGGATGSACKNSPASCQVGDLSDKWGAATITSGGSGTGLFTANYVDPYLSIQPGDDAYIGKGSIVVMDANGGYVACANFVNSIAHLPTKTKGGSMASASSSSSAGGSSGGNSGASSSSDNFASKATIGPLIGAGALGLAALLL